MNRWCMVVVCAVVLPACLLSAPSYDQTQFSCPEPPYLCPLGYDCVDGVCVRPEDAPDTGVSQQTPDAALPGADDGADTDAALATTEVVLSGSGLMDDTYIRPDRAAINYGHNGFVSIDADPLQIGLTWYDLSTIPATAQVVSAELVVYINDPIEDGELVTYRLLEAWNEYEATYDQRKDGVPWSGAGPQDGTYDPTPVFTFAPRAVGSYTIPLPVTLVQSWVAQPETNYGLAWVSNSQAGRGGQFHSSENASDPPVIRVRYR